MDEVPAEGAGASEANEEDEEATSPAESFGTRIGVGLAIMAVVWAFLGPARVLELGRFELPIVASFVEPLPYAFFGYIAGVTFAFGLVGALVFPSLGEPTQESYESDLAVGLIVPTIILVLAMIVLGFLFPALFYAVGGEFVRGGLILLGVVVLVVAGFLLRTFALIGIVVASAPLWAPALAGAYAGGTTRRVVT